MKRMRIIVDQDDTLALTNRRWLDLYNRDWDDDLSLEDIKGWNWHYWVKPECGKRIYEYLNMPGFFVDIEPMPYALEVMHELCEMGHDLVVATATPKISDIAYTEKRRWFRNNLPFLPEENFISIHRKGLLRGDVLFDDGAHNTTSWPGVSVIMDRPWNRGESCAHYRVFDWPQFFDLILKIGDKIHMHTW